MKNRIWHNAFLLLVLTTFFWGGNAVVGRFLAEAMGPLTISFIRILLSIAIFVPLVYKTMKKEWLIARNHIKTILLLSLSGVIGYNLLCYWALHYTTAVHVTLINSAAPIFITILAYVSLKERITRPLICAILCSIVGVITVMTHGELSRLLQLQVNVGDLIMIFSVMSWAVYSVTLKKFMGSLSFLSTFGYSLLFAIPMLAPFTLIELIFIPIHKIGGGEILSLVYLGIFPSILAFLFWNQAVHLIGPSKASVFINLTPVFGGVLAYFLLSEALTFAHFIGGLLVFSGVLIVSKRTQHPLNKSEETSI
ncbi:DMT family transporter [Alkalihalobacillus oceani]|uniref:DMT family transporter n=1 Tax=Halalkalibacter oceani TaxID=1653776 RepID=UPI0020420E79|nr:DMT family transporter [Halalkalibacter oceani]